MGCVTIPLPPVESADQLTHLKSKCQKFQRRLSRSVASNTIAVANIQLRLVERFSGVVADFSVREADRAGDMLFGVSKGGAAVDDDDLLVILQGLIKICRVPFRIRAYAGRNSSDRHSWFLLLLVPKSSSKGKAVSQRPSRKPSLPIRCQVGKRLALLMVS